MVLCLTVQCFLRQTQRPIKYGKGPLFVLQICTRDCSFKIGMVWNFQVLIFATLLTEYDKQSRFLKSMHDYLVLSSPLL